ncbi:hypothetical protein ACFU8R_28145 [Pseudonocardia alni]|jgi:hypothetical protein|uniref:hypothetical protein n=1 Tax=Pseudonocardia alni TaxID=33907 RepID=UPI003332C83A
MGLTRMTLIATLAVISLTSACVVPRHADLDRRTGCDVLSLNDSISEQTVLLDVRVTGCRAPDGTYADPADAADRVAAAVWQSTERPVDVLRVIIADPHRTAPSAQFGRSELDDRFGPGPRGVVVPIYERGPGDGLWYLLAVAYFAIALTMLRVARHHRERGVIIFLLRR